MQRPCGRREHDKHELEEDLCRWSRKGKIRNFPGGAVVKNLPANAGDMGSSPGLGRSHMLWSN